MYLLFVHLALVCRIRECGLLNGWCGTLLQDAEDVEDLARERQLYALPPIAPALPSRPALV
eukprot:133623-Pleurochrysis_carterae.AAC.2